MRLASPVAAIGPDHAERPTTCGEAGDRPLGSPTGAGRTGR